MKLFSYLLLVLVIILNLLFAEPSFADAPKITKTPEYKELSRKLDTLQDQLEAAKSGESLLGNFTVEDLQKRVDELSFQKYALEKGVNWGQCRNETGETIAVYGPKPEKSKSEYDNALYFLGSGESTGMGWDCQGIFVPNGTKIASLNTDGAVVIKNLKGTQLIARTNPDKDGIELNINPDKVFKSGDINWYIPNVSSKSISTRVTDVPNGSLESD
ncbi:hypothetical protein NIES4071_17910 [Calothrix sp. NIES-4071]|nr:hypothetical protein NIES4071_17910 [Calothrix sp. NIES-4071]BAZ56124.1 hypothetical protein NIES4105_17860 [Calothrix sp. NIES-4105]